MTKSEKLTLKIYGACIALLYIMWISFQIFFYFEDIKRTAELEKSHQEHLIKQQKLQERLEYLQKKYAKDLEDEKRVSQINVFTLNYDDIELLATNNYYESRGVGRKNWKKKERDMQNVTSVVLNRLDSGKYGNTIRQVLQAAKKKQNNKYVCQFSWVCDDNRPAIDKQSREWKLAYGVAFDIYTGITQRTVKAKALHYYNPIKAKPRWAKRAKEVAYIHGGHRIIIID